MLSEFRRGSSCCSSASKPGAKRTSVGESRPPRRTIAASVRLCRAIFRPNMGGALLFDCGSARLGFMLARDCFGVMDLLHGIHAAVSFGQQALDIKAIVGTERGAHAQRDQFPPAHMASGFDGGLVQTLSFLSCSLGGQPGGGNYEFVSAHAGDVVVSAASFF